MGVSECGGAGAGARGGRGEMTATAGGGEREGEPRRGRKPGGGREERRMNFEEGDLQMARV